MAIDHAIITSSTACANGSSNGIDSTPRGVHLVGSVPLNSCDSVEEVWSKLFSVLPGRLNRVPDGELGYRHYYVNWQADKFPSAVLRTNNMIGDLPTGTGDTTYVPKLEDIKLLGYSDAAIESYRRFVERRKAGVVPKGTRFQVCLPSPLEAIGIHISPLYQHAVFELYEKRMHEDVARLQKMIPNHDLSIQIDVAVTFGFLETERGNLDAPYFQPWFPRAMEYSMAVLKKMAETVSPDAELGFHLCYGDVEHQHFVQPQDASLLVEVANRMIHEVHQAQHPIAFFHMPVPKDRTDPQYFAPLKKLALPEETQLFLGVVHFDDLKGTKERIAAAKKFVPKTFGVATECGMGRTPKAQFDNILEICKEASGPYIDQRSKI